LVWIKTAEDILQSPIELYVEDFRARL